VLIPHVAAPLPRCVADSVCRVAETEGRPAWQLAASSAESGDGHNLGGGDLSQLSGRDGENGAWCARRGPNHVVAEQVFVEIGVERLEVAHRRYAANGKARPGAHKRGRGPLDRPDYRGQPRLVHPVGARGEHKYGFVARY
jgi:hypothetical protein